MFGVPVVTAACVLCCRRAMGAASARRSLRLPLSRANIGKPRTNPVARRRTCVSF